MCIFLELFKRLEQEFVFNHPDELSFWRALRGSSQSSPPANGFPGSPGEGFYHSSRCSRSLGVKRAAGSRCSGLQPAIRSCTAGFPGPFRRWSAVSGSLRADPKLLSLTPSLASSRTHSFLWFLWRNRLLLLLFPLLYLNSRSHVNLTSSTVANLQVVGANALVLTSRCASVCDAQELSEAELFRRSSTSSLNPEKTTILPNLRG